MLRRLGPLTPGHPSVGTPCAACRQLFDAGDQVTLVPVGPGDDPKEQRKAREGRPYNAHAVVVHWVCATGGGEEEESR